MALSWRSDPIGSGKNAGSSQTHLLVSLITGEIFGLNIVSGSLELIWKAAPFLAKLPCGVDKNAALMEIQDPNLVTMQDSRLFAVFAVMMMPVFVCGVLL